MAKEGRLKVEKFNGQGFQFWKMQMEDYLYQKDLYQPLEDKTKKPSSMSDEEWGLLDRKALGAIRLYLSSSVAFNFSTEKTNQGVMDKLTKMYEKPSTSNKVYLMKKLFSMNMNEGSLIQDHSFWERLVTF